MRNAHTSLASRLVSVVAAGAVAAATLAFAPAPAPAAAAAALPDVGVEFGPDGAVRTVAGAADRFGLAPGGSMRDPAAREARIRRLLELRGHRTARATDGACLGACADQAGRADAAGPDEGPAPTLVVGRHGGSFPTADLDGDGTDDVLVLRETHDADHEVVDASVEARSGADGALLWHGDEPGFFASVPDLDGDGLPDLLSGWFTYLHADGPAACADPLQVSCDGYAYTVGETMVLTAYAGTTGAELGSVTLSSTYRETHRTTDVPVGLYTGRDEVEVVLDDMVLGLAFLDADGDGDHELVHDRNDVTYRYDGVATINDTPFGFADLVAGTEAEEATGEVVVVDLAEGTSTVATADAEALLVAGAVDIGEGARLLLERFPAIGSRTGACVDVTPLPYGCVDDGQLPGGSTAAAPTRTLHGGDLEPVWEVALAETSSMVLPIGGDLDGDGVADLVDLRIDLDTFEDLVVAVDGATGTDVWQADATIATLADDVVVGGRVRFEPDVDGEAIAVDAVRLEPATGAVLGAAPVARASVELPDDGDVMVFGFAGIGLAPLVGAGADVLGEAYLAVHEFGGDCEMGEDPETGDTTEECWFGEGELLAEAYDLGGVDGDDLAVVLRRGAEDDFVFDVVDLDRDGEAELLTVGAQGVRAEHLDGSTLWTLPPDVWPSGLLATPTGPDVLLDEADATVVRAGADLALRWSIPA